MNKVSVKRFSSETGETMACTCCERDCKRGYIINGRFYGDKCGANVLGISAKKLDKAADSGSVMAVMVSEDEIYSRIQSHLKNNRFVFAEQLKVNHKQVKPLVDKGLIVKENHPNWGTIYKYADTIIPVVGR